MEGNPSPDKPLFGLRHGRAEEDGARGEGADGEQMEKRWGRLGRTRGRRTWRRHQGAVATFLLSKSRKGKAAFPGCLSRGA